jgi:hypothetical protein
MNATSPADAVDAVVGEAGAGAELGAVSTGAAPVGAGASELTATRVHFCVAPPVQGWSS